MVWIKILSREKKNKFFNIILHLMLSLTQAKTVLLIWRVNKHAFIAVFLPIWEISTLQTGVNAQKMSKCIPIIKQAFLLSESSLVQGVLFATGNISRMLNMTPYPPSEKWSKSLTPVLLCSLWVWLK